jgi:ElaA protein
VRFSELDAHCLYEILSLRQAVFVVEQRCAFVDADGRDLHAWHLLGRDARGTLVAYLRLLPPGVRFPEPSLGRILTKASIRGEGVGKTLVREGIRKSGLLFPGQPIRISAQLYLEDYYVQLGFSLKGDGNPYDEDGIPHIEMVYREQGERTM